MKLMNWLLGLALMLPPYALAHARPSVVLIVADDLGYGDISSYGATDISTPRIDMLASQGVRFTQGYAVSSICSPSRAGMMSGHYPQRFADENNPPDTHQPDIGLPLDEMTLAEVMKSAGYATAAFGKWHLGEGPAYHPNNRGFDYFYGFLGGQNSYISHTGLNRNGIPTRFDGYLTDALAIDAVDWISHQTGPFFAYVSFNAPHAPRQAKQQYLDQYRNVPEPRRTHVAQVASLDENVGDN